MSPDGGAHWGPDRVLVENEGRENVMSVSLLRLPAGEVLLLYLVKNGWGDCRAYLRRSPDDFETLSERTSIMDETGYYVVNNDRLVRLGSGRLVVPAALHPCPGGTRETWSARGLAMCFLSDDEGRTWRRSRGILEPPPEAGDEAFQEPGVVELRDGRLWMWMRTNVGCQWQSFSADGGETWCRATPSVLASPISPASIKRVPATGDLLAVWNDHSGRHPLPANRRARTPLCAAISRDDGHTWSPSRALESGPEGWYCYTSITFAPDVSGEGERVILSYCAGDPQVGRLNRLKVTSLSLTWLYQR